MPMIVRFPGKVPVARTDDFVWTFWDVMPTLAELAGVDPPSGIDGISVLPRLLGQPQEEPNRFLYWEKIPARHGLRQMTIIPRPEAPARERKRPCSRST